MPYAEIKFIKLFLKLFDKNDKFLFQLNDRQQLLYIKMLYLAGKTQNQIPKNPSFIISKVNYKDDNKVLTNDMTKLMNTFDTFTQNKSYYYFTNFHELHNWYSNGTPKSSERSAKSSSQNKNKNKKKNKNNKENPQLEKKVNNVFQFFNEHTDSQYKSDSYKANIRARLKEGYSVEDCRLVIRYKYWDWKDDEDMAKHINPITFFRPTKFEKYLNGAKKTPSKRRIT